MFLVKREIREFLD